MKDDGIIELLQSRDEKAIEMTAERYGRYCMQIAMNILHNEWDAEECVNDAYLRLLVRMQTDGIPDAIRYVVATDGKTLVVSYKTYKDFENVYNDYNKLTSGDSLRYAVIDLETGIVYKNGAVYS